jgi:hypothetical protein
MMCDLASLQARMEAHTWYLVQGVFVADGPEAPACDRNRATMTLRL